MSEKRARLVALIEHLDSGIGQVLNRLDVLGLATNTLVIFTSDNGGVLACGANNGPWRGHKGQMYEGGLRVPGAARWLGHIQPGTQTERPTLTMDIFATLCDVAGVSAPAEIDGRSFLPTLRGQTGPEPQRDYYFVRREGGPGWNGKTIEALTSGDWKLLQPNPFAQLELYDLKADPAEVTNRALIAPKVFRDLAAKLAIHLQRGGQVPWQAPGQ